MKFIDKLERKFGNRGIENLTIYIIVSYVLGYALMYINPGALSMLSLNVSEILHGQIWTVPNPNSAALMTFLFILQDSPFVFVGFYSMAEFPICQVCLHF